MATKPKAILSTHDGREASPITKASNVLFEDGQTAQDILNDRQDAMISPVIENSSSMFKVGQGDNVDYSANVVNGAYESMVLKGKSMVNCIQEPSSKDVVLPYEFEDGQYVTINDTKESGALGVELKGQTLVNLAQGLKNEVSSSASMVLLRNISVKANTQYVVMAKVKSSNAVSLAGVSSFLRIDSDTTGRILGGVTGNIETTYTPKVFVFNTSDTTLITINLRNAFGDWGLAENTAFAKEIMLIEYQEGMEEWDIPYFEGMASCKMPTLHTVGKNLFNYKNYNLKVNEGQNPQEIIVDEQGLSFNVDTASWKSLWYDLYLESGENYKLSYDTNLLKCFIFKSKVNTYTNSELIASATVIDATEDKIQKVEKTFTAPSTGFIRIRLTSEQKTGNHTLQNFQIEKGTTATTYEPYKSSILSTPSDLELRGIGNVKDTLNLQTGELTQRIGEVVLDGLTGWLNTNYSTSSTVCFDISINLKGKIYEQSSSAGLICAELPPKNWIHFYGSKTDEEGVVLNRDSGSIIHIKISRDKLTTHDYNGVTNYLKQNPITVQYVLATPIIKKVSLTFTNQDNQPTTKLSTYNTTTHINASSQEGSLIPTLSHVNPNYPVILKPSTKYSIVADSYSNGHTNSPINFNLGGATVSTTVGSRVSTVTTPSTLTSEKLTMSGRGNKLNNVMVIEGEVVGDEPYFEGMCDSKSPILSNTGKNLFSCSLMMGLWGTTQGKPVPNDNYFCTTDFIKVHPNTVVKVSGTAFNPNATGNVIFYGKDKNYLGNDMQAWVLNNAKIPSNAHYMGFHFRVSDLYDIDGTVQIEVVDDVSSPTTAYEPYKSNILSCTGGIIKLTEDMFEQGTTAQYTANIGKTYQWMKENSTSSYDARRLRTKSLIKIEPNTKLILQNTDNFMYAMSGYGVDKLSLGTFDTGWVQNTTITIPQDVHYISFAIRKKDDTSITISDFKNTKFTLSEVDKTIVLRSLPNGVCDTLNVETGEYVKRIGEVVLDGSTNLCGTQMGVDNHIVFYIVKDDFKGKGRPSVSSDNFPTYSVTTFDKRGMFGESNGERHIWFILPYNLLKTNDLQGALDWLRENPTTVQYELETPIVTTVDLSGYPFSYENGHVVLSSGSIEQSLTPKVEYSVATNRNGQIRSNQKMVEKHQKELDRLQAIILANLVNSQYNQTLTTLKYELSRV